MSSPAPSPANQTLEATDFQLALDPSTGGIWMKYKLADGKVVAVLLKPEHVVPMVASLAACATKSSHQEAKQALQVFATRNLHARVSPGPVLVLDQELEIGWSMTLTLDMDDAKRLLLELQTGIDAVEQVVPSSPRH